MAKGDKTGQSPNRITDDQRFSYIGFEAFPSRLTGYIVAAVLIIVLAWTGILSLAPASWWVAAVITILSGLLVWRAYAKMREILFRDERERVKFTDGVLARRESSSTLREDCKLLEERVSLGEKVVLTLASLAILSALLLPWYSVYMEVPVVAEESVMTEVAADSTALAVTGADTLALAEDSLAAGAITEETGSDEISLLPAEADADAAGAAEDVSVEGLEPEPADASGVVTHAGGRAHEQILTAGAARIRTQKEYSRLSGLGVFTALGSIGAPVFSSGFVLALTGVLLLIFGLLCVAVPVINLYGVFVLKGKPDEVALKLKKYLRLNWLPPVLFMIVVSLSFVGADYGFDSAESFTSLGNSYGVGVLLGSLSWGVLVPLAASLLVAVKGIEI